IGPALPGVLKIVIGTAVMTVQIRSQVGLMMTFQANEMARLMNPHAICTTSHSAKKPGIRNVVMNHLTSVKIGWMMLFHAQVMIAATALETKDTVVQMIWNAGITTD